MRIGGIANTAAATTVARLPKPIAVEAKMSSSASVGSAREALASTTAKPPPRRTCPSQTPTGRATTAAMRTAAADMPRCSASRAGTPAGPVQLSGSLSQTTASPVDRGA